MDTEARLKKLELIYDRASRKLPHRVSVAAVPYPVSEFCKEALDGVALHYMFPAAGTIARACFYIEEATAETQFIASITNMRGDSISKNFTVPKRGLIVDVSISVVSGDRLLVLVPEGTQRIWTALLWKPNISDHVLKTLAAEEIEHALQNEEAG